MRDAQVRKVEELGARLLTEAEFSRYSLPEHEAAKLKRAEMWCEDVIDFFHAGEGESGCVLPWGKTHSVIRLRCAELSVWAGVNGHGKSLIVSQAVLGLLRQSQKACIASMEMKPLQTMARMVRQGVGGESPAPNLVREFASSLDGNLWLYDQQGTVDAKRMLAVVRYAREELGIDHFVIDSLMKCGMGVDDYNAQKHFVDALSTYAKDSGLHIHLIAHSRKRENEHRVMDKFDIKGAGEITDMADNVFTLWRNKTKEEKAQKGDLKGDEENMPDAILKCDKQRNGEWEGNINLWFVKRALQYVAKPTTQTIDMMRWPFND